jgi:uncharacterized protein (TIGR03382 family)
MHAQLRRWLWAQESPKDDLAGGLIAGLAVLLIFRFLFGDSWAFSLIGGAVVAVASLVFSWLSRRRRGTRTTGS